MKFEMPKKMVMTRMSLIGDKAVNHYDIITRRRTGKFGLVSFSLLLLFAIIGPSISPHGDEIVMEDGEVLNNHPPTLEYPFGTTWMGEDMLSLSLLAIRTDILIGAISGFMVMMIGANIGLIAGYYGGKVDNFLMRVTDLVYGLPLEPFAIVLISLTGQTIYHVVVAISLILWRTVARVIRSEVLSVKTNTYVQVARDRGISDVRIIYGHIAPNIFHLLFLYTTFSIAWGIIFNASLSFLGFGDPDRLSLGGLMYETWAAGVWSFSWWTFFFPGILLSILVMSVFFIGQAYEQESNPQLKTY